MNVRDWLYVRDHAEALWQVLTRGRDGETYNIGGHNEWANIRIVELICDLMDELAPAIGRLLAAPDHLCQGPARPRPPLRH